MITMSAYAIPGLKREIQYSMWQNPNLSKNERMMVICVEVSDCFKVPTKGFIGKGRKGRNLVPRNFSMYFAKRLIKLLTLKETGKFFGGRDHTTVMHGVHTLKDWFCADDGTLRSIHLSLCEKFKLNAESDWALAITESNNARYRVKRRLHKLKLKDEPVEAKKKIKPEKTRKSIYKPLWVDKPQERITRTAGIYTNSNWEQKLEERAKALAI